MHLVDIIIVAYWIVFWIYWRAVSLGVKTGETRWTRFCGGRVGVMLVVLRFARLKALYGHLSTSDPWLQGPGPAVFFSGLALAVWANSRVGNQRLSKDAAA
jgi:hypothetical protein